MRTWKCPDCSHTVAIDYDWLATNGTPICGTCDRDMELQPADDAPPGRDALEKLLAEAERAGLESSDLDEAVHELAASIAADKNNGGLEEQLGYLVDAMGGEAVGKELDRLAEAKAHGGAEEHDDD